MLLFQRQIISIFFTIYVCMTLRNMINTLFRRKSEAVAPPTLKGARISQRLEDQIEEVRICQTTGRSTTGKYYVAGSCEMNCRVACSYRYMKTALNGNQEDYGCRKYETK